MSDSELVDRARQGDQSAFGELVRRHQGAVFRAALAALGSPEDAEEIAQDAFVAAYSNLEGFREEASFRTWVVAIAWRRAGAPPPPPPTHPPRPGAGRIGGDPQGWKKPAQTKQGAKQTRKQ
ncbi:MAG: sigma factor, partial [Vicinamibacterales bacterium]|nr:sigma factor [Vicinamibacterales bacterium]